MDVVNATSLKKIENLQKKALRFLYLKTGTVLIASV